MNGNIYSTIVGTIASDPEPFYKVKGDEEPIGCTFRVAINRCTRDGDQWKTYTQFIEITARGYRSKDLIASKWCKKGYHAYFQCEQTERTYTARDGATRHAAVFNLLDAHPILVSANYAMQKNCQEKQAIEQKSIEAHRQAGAPTHTTPPLRHYPQEAEEDIPF